MINQLKRTGIIAALISLPFAANAATISGQIDIAGTVNIPNSTFNAGGDADLSDTGTVIFANGDFTGLSVVGSNIATLHDIEFTNPSTIWEVGGFSFVANVFDAFQDGTVKAFTALGVISGNGFDATNGTLSFSAQLNGGAVDVSFSTTTSAVDSAPAPVPVPAAGPLLLLGLGGLAAARRKKRKA